MVGCFQVVESSCLQIVEDKGLFYTDQFGFRPGHSTELASVRFVDTLVRTNRQF